MTEKTAKRVYTYSLFLGFALLCWQILIYRKTIVDPKLLSAIVIIATIIGVVMISRNYSKIYPIYSGIKLMFFTVLQSLISFGFIVSGIFILMNFYLSSGQIEIQQHTIISRSSMSGGKRHRNERKPIFEIQFNSYYRKQLVFSHQFYERRNEFKIIELEVKEGFFGFDILENKTLK
ncbi:hypothetical protein LY01_00650 [Nonlabens xylanidelens]|uniref:Uncharacterized protein n=1 Tax=Nonlabens xylanidelens TaxID=191564 RepID=A0A2S6IRP4_9FLAO|nr:hypothetical protein [Nonlabens xylanidelens]PPK96825.1 hypothetical protein LY01_00650 [Nonlabens xylanidelens]PQJ13526.1 hypothetical protein BST94_14320 [Nonlabens xylanidelens]